MSYIVFARKWRPKVFDRIVGQEHAVTTLKNAIAQNRVAHAYIFSGPRGVGKTTTARIFAMALNCKDAPTQTPCGACDSCRETSSGTSLDVIEIDGASNRGIEEVRALRENVKFSPARGKFKIYIIDEVHMLTEEAFNALLKTLEEPPPHAIFIFATTRPHKVPQTILSRCQRFDFRRLSLEEIVGKLKVVAEEEALVINEEALYTIARAAEGSMRDAESMLDQLASFCGKEIDPESASSILGMVEQEVLFGFAEKVINEDAHGVLKLISQLIGKGQDIPQFVNSLVGHFRNILVAKAAEEPSALIDLPKDAVERIRAQAERFTIEALLYILTVLTNTQDAVRRSVSQRIPLELAAIRLTRMEGITSLSTILDRLCGLEKRMEGRDLASAGAGQVITRIGGADIKRDAIQPHKDLVPPRQEAAGGAEAKEAPLLTMESVCGIWTGLIRLIASKKMSVAQFLQAAQPLKFQDGTLLIGFARENKFNKEALEANDNKKIIERALKEILRQELRVEFKTVEALEKRVAVEGIEPQGEKALTEGVIKSALDIFGGVLRKTGPA